MTSTPAHCEQKSGQQVNRRKRRRSRRKKTDPEQENKSFQRILRRRRKPNKAANKTEEFYAATISPIFRRGSQKRKAHYYLEYGGGLGDVFNGLFHRGSYNLLDNLQKGEQATVALICHNPHAQELFEKHPKRSQISILNLGYWDPNEDARKRAEHKLPRPGGLNRLPEGRPGPVQFYPNREGQGSFGPIERPALRRACPSSGRTEPKHP